MNDPWQNRLGLNGLQQTDQRIHGQAMTGRTPFPNLGQWIDLWHIFSLIHQIPYNTYTNPVQSRLLFSNNLNLSLEFQKINLLNLFKNYSKIRFWLKCTLPMSISKLIKQKALTAGDISLVIQLAWEDRTTFETIRERIGLSEAEVINLMRAELKPRSFSLWRKRVKGRTTKHRALRHQDMKFDDRQIADHRRANC